MVVTTPPTTSKIQQFWMECVKSALAGGQEMCAAINCADNAIYAFDGRFNPQDPKKSHSAGAALDVVLAYVPTEHLIHKYVIADFNPDRRIIGRIKDFDSAGVSPAGEQVPTKVLVRYEEEAMIGEEEGGKIEVWFATAHCRMVSFPLPIS